VGIIQVNSTEALGIIRRRCLKDSGKREVVVQIVHAISKFSVPSKLRLFVQ